MPSPSDTGGVAQHPLLPARIAPSTLSVRRRRRRSVLCPLSHGFPLAYCSGITRGYAWYASSGGVVGAGGCGSEGMAECVYR